MMAIWFRFVEASKKCRAMDRSAKAFDQPSFLAASENSETRAPTAEEGIPNFEAASARSRSSKVYPESAHTSGATSVKHSDTVSNRSGIRAGRTLGREMTLVRK